MGERRQPPLENVFLKALSAALGQRWKALSYRSRKFRLESSLDSRGGVTFERLDFEINLDLSGRSQVRFTAWEDSQSWIWMGRLKKNAGWIYKVESHCNLWGLPASEIVQRIEATIRMSPFEDRTSTPEDVAQLEKIWIPSVAEANRSKRKRR